MNIFKPNIEKKEKEIKSFSVKPILKKTYGWNWKLLSQISKNTKAIEDVALEMNKLNKKMDSLIDNLSDK